MTGASSRLTSHASRRLAAFTMIEIALCLAIVSFALLVIIGVLPRGMHTQRDTREETIISQDASMLLEAIRNGSRGLDDLTNNVYAITNHFTVYDSRGQPQAPAQGTDAGFTYTSGYNNVLLTNGLSIIGLLSTPEFVVIGTNQPLANPFANGGRGYVSNHIYAYVRSFSGLAAEKPPQNNQIMQADTFSYRIVCVNAPMAADTNSLSSLNKNPSYSAYSYQLAGNLRELRLLFQWPLLPNASLPARPARQTFRASVGGQIFMTNSIPLHGLVYNAPFYFYQSQSYTNAP